jgi:hypothetical protein
MMESDPLLGGDNCDGTDPLFAGPDCCDGVVPSVVLVHWLLGFLPLLLSEHHDDLMFMSIILTAEFAWLVYIASRRTQNTRRRLPEIVAHAALITALIFGVIWYGSAQSYNQIWFIMFGIAVAFILTLKISRWYCRKTQLLGQ